MNTSRRSFLRTGGIMGVTAIFTGRFATLALGQQKSNPSLGTGIGNTVPKTATLDPLYHITRAMFTQNLNSKFSFSSGAVYLADFTLIAVNDLNPPYAKGDGTSTAECFALVFQGPSGLALSQGTYSIRHKTLGSFNLFIVPATVGAKAGRHFEALINRVMF
jgi:hypothetical protein